MGKWIFGCMALLLATPSLSQQEASLPPDLRQHNLLAVSPHLFNPVFSLEQQSRHEIGLWSRWQWQTIDGDPTTFLADYTVRFSRLAAGAGFVQNNILHFQQTGFVLNLAYEFPISERARISRGANFFGYVQELTDNRFLPDEPLLPFEDDTLDFIWRLAPAVQFSYDSFGVSLAFENLPDYSFDAQGPATPSGAKTYLISSHYPLFASYRFGGLDNRKKVVGFEAEVEKEMRLEAERAEAERIAQENARRDALQTEAALAASRRADSVQTAQRLAEQARLQEQSDSTRLALAEQTRAKDSLAQARLAAAEEVTLKPGEVYQEVSAEDGLEPGFYLIANVYGTNRYLDAFLNDLRKKGLEPQSLYRTANKFNYVYLKRYETMSEARQARDSKFGGKYQGDLWIFRVR